MRQYLFVICTPHPSLVDCFTGIRLVQMSTTRHRLYFPNYQVGFRGNFPFIIIIFFSKPSWKNVVTRSLPCLLCFCQHPFGMNIVCVSLIGRRYMQGKYLHITAATTLHSTYLSYVIMLYHFVHKNASRTLYMTMPIAFIC